MAVKRLVFLLLVDNITPERFSVFWMPNRTNDLVEAFGTEKLFIYLISYLELWNAKTKTCAIFSLVQDLSRNPM